MSSNGGRALSLHQSSGSVAQMVPQRLFPSLIDLEHLSPEEQSIILSVLDRDEQLRSYEQDRVKKLKGELHELRKKSAAKAADENDNNRVCVRCRESLGRLFKTGDNCPKCQHRVCKNCQVTLPSGTRWLCTVCHKAMQLQLETGEWYYKKLQIDEVPLLGSDLVKASLAKAKHSLTDPTTAPVLTASDLRSKTTSSRGKGSRGHKQRGRMNSRSSSDYGSSTTRESSQPSVRYENSSSDPNSPIIHVHVSHTTSSSRVGKQSEVNSDPEDHPRGRSGIKWKKAAVVNQAGNRLHKLKGNRKTNALKPGTHVRSHSSGSERFSAADSSEVDTVIEPISGFAFQRVSFRKDRGNSDNASSDSTDPGKGGNEMGCMQCNEQDPSCIPAGLPEDDQDYYIKANDKQPANSNVDLAKDGPVISVEIVDDGDGDEEDIDRHFMVHGGLTPEARRKFGINNNSKSYAESESSHAQITSSQAFLKNDKDTASEIVQKDLAGPVPSEEVMGVASNSPPSPTASTPIPPDGTTSPNSLSIAPTFSKSNSLSRSSVSSLQRKIQSTSTLSKGSSVSMTSLYSQAGEENYGKYVITGDIRFGLNYNYKTNVFEVKIKACRDLAPVDIKKIKSDPYVKTYLLPDKTKASKRKTYVRKGTVNPQFDITLRYHITQSELETRTLSVTVWNNDAFGRNDFLGEVLVNMDSVKLDDYKLQWHQLCNKSQQADGAVAYKGDLTIALMYTDVNTQEVDEKESKKKKKKDKKDKKGLKTQQSTEGGVLHVKIKEARNLVGVRMGGSSNPFVKGYLEPDRSKVGKHKTAVIRGTCNPSWDHVMKFENVSLRSLKGRCLELTVWDHETLASNEFLGGTRLNLGTGEYQNKPASWNDATGNEIKAWEQMLKRTGIWTETTIVLRPNMVTQLPYP